MTIRQIMPAEKWWIIFREGDEFIRVPMVCFALCENNAGSTEILPMGEDDKGGIVPCRDIEGYDSIAHEEELDIEESGSK